MKKLLLMLLVLSLLCSAAICASAAGSDMVEGDMSTLNWEFEADLALTTAGQTIEFQMPAETYLMQLNISKQLDGELLYISAAANVIITSQQAGSSRPTTLHPVDGWYCLEVATLYKHQISVINWNPQAVVLTFKVPAPQPTLFDIDVARMILGNALEFQFGVATSKIPDKTGYYAIIEKTWADGTTTTKTIPAEDWGKSGSYHAIVYDGLAAKEMGDTFYVTIYNAKGEAVSNPKQDAVRDYVARAYASQPATGKTMMVDMLNYGAAAQLHFKYGTNDLANSKLTAAQKATGTATTPEMRNDQVKGINYQGSRFILESRIQVQLAFKNMTSSMYAVYTYTNAAGKAQTVRVEGKDFVVISGKPAGVELSALVYADARALVNVTVYNANGTVYGTATDSIESCAYRSTGDVFAALMKFADSAKAHLYD